MPPRLQCLNSPRVSLFKSLWANESFSTSSKAFIDATDPSQFPPDSSPKSTLKGFETIFKKQPRRGSQGDGSSTASLTRLMQKYEMRRREAANHNSNQPRLDTAQELQQYKLSTELSRQITRRWKAGDVYAPHDLSAQEMKKWRQRGQPSYDAFDRLGMNPLNEYKNFSILSEYVSPMGRIKHSRVTGLRPVNQRKIAKAIRRSVGIGMMPSVYKHPELLYISAAKGIRNVGMRDPL